MRIQLSFSVMNTYEAFKGLKKHLFDSIKSLYPPYSKKRC
jgi:hypothetical protein